MKISNWSLGQIETCSWMYKLRFIDHAEGKPNDRNFCVGAVCDELVQDWFGTGCERGWMLRHADAYYVRYIDTHRIVWRDIAKATLAKEGVSNDKSLLRARVRKYIPKVEATIIRAGLTNKRRLQLQRRFNVEFPGHAPHRLVGAADFFDHEDRTVYELKVTKNKLFLNVDQILFYVAAFTARDKEKVNKAVFLSPLMRPAILRVPFDYYQVRGLLIRVLKAIRLVEKGDFTPCGKSQPCYTCEFRGPLCPAWAGKSVPISVDRGMRRVSLV